MSLEESSSESGQDTTTEVGGGSDRPRVSVLYFHVLVCLGFDLIES